MCCVDRLSRHPTTDMAERRTDVRLVPTTDMRISACSAGMHQREVGRLNNPNYVTWACKPAVYPAMIGLLTDFA